MAVLHALLVAINDYKEYPLKGCINDMKAFRDYLESYCKANSLLPDFTELIDADTTRDNITSAFAMFEEAAADDICLLYFAGHGSHYPVPEPFRHLEPDGELETFVCFDSRFPGGRDLVDKELSFLIWEVSQTWENKGAGKQPFITIMDCCHSGAFRSHLDHASDVLIREISPPSWSSSPEEFYGYERYHRTDNNRVAPPLARRIHLGAARDMEIAKEVKIAGQRRGIFTFGLLEALAEYKGIIPYDELIKRINFRVRSAVSDQYSQLQVSNTSDKRLLFLTKVPAPDKEHYLVEYAREESNWKIDAGSIHGVPENTGDQKTVFRLLDFDHRVEVKEVMPTYSVVEPMAGFNVNRPYPAKIEALAEPRYRVLFARDIDPKGKRLLDNALKENASDLYRITTDPAQARFVFQARNQTFTLLRKLDESRLGRPVKGFSSDGAREFLSDVEKILKWAMVRSLENPFSTIQKEELSIQLSRVIDPGNYENNTKVEGVDWSSPTLFEYKALDGRWRQPAFQLRITNTGSRQLSVSLLYLAYDFSITNQLIQHQVLEPGQEVWALDIAGGKNYHTILLQLEDHFIRGGLDTIEETLKVLVSTAPFSTDRFNQEGITWAEGFQGGRRGLSLREPQSDWLTLDISILIRRDKASL